MTMKQLAQRALGIQNAINLSGLVQTWAEDILNLRDHLPNYNTDQINQHPINQLWASKVHELTRMGLSDCDTFEKAYKECEKLANG